jgi:hypothetical protein
VNICVRNKLPGEVDIYRITASTPVAVASGEDAVFTDPSGLLTDRYGAMNGAIYLIRPDGYIGFRSPIDGAENYVGERLDNVYSAVAW